MLPPSSKPTDRPGANACRRPPPREPVIDPDPAAVASRAAQPVGELQYRCLTPDAPWPATPCNSLALHEATSLGGQLGRRS